MAAHNDPFRHTCLVPYVDAATAPPDVAAKINVLPFRRNVFLVLAHARGPFPHLMSLLGTFFNGQLRTVQLLEWVRPPPPPPPPRRQTRPPANRARRSN